MRDIDVAELLKTEWGNLPEQLGDDWEDFLAQYQQIVRSSPQKPTRGELTVVVDKIRELLHSHQYTARKLGEWSRARPPGREKLLASGSETLGDEEKIQLISNQFRSLADDPTGPDPVAPSAQGATEDEAAISPPK
jgi:hypothetical protein